MAAGPLLRVGFGFTEKVEVAMSSNASIEVF
jgi:hypothetical protein